jgi:hypothetical protein
MFTASVGSSGAAGNVIPPSTISPSAPQSATTNPATAAGSSLVAQRMQNPVAPLTSAEREQIGKQTNQWGLPSSTQPAKDNQRLALLNRVVGNSDRYPAFPGKSNGEYASTLRGNLLTASRQRDDAQQFIHDSGQSQRPSTLFGLGASPLSEAWANLDRANATLASTRAEIDKYLDNGSSRRFYLESTIPTDL